MLPAFIFHFHLMLKNTFQYFDFGYYLRFAGLYFFFYLTYTFVISASVPTGVYYPFVENYLNIPAVIKDCILAISKVFLGVLGHPSTIHGDYIQSSDGYVRLFMAFPCYGLGVKSFWVAFVCAHKMDIKQKISWSIAGIFLIFFLNCLRVTVMMIAMVDGWTIAQSLNTNAHDFFNYVCYAALFGLILLFYKKAKTNSKTIEAKSTVPAQGVRTEPSVTTRP